MPGMTVSIASADASSWWLWVVLTAVPDVLLIVSLIALWRRLVLSRVQTRQELARTRAELGRSSEALWLSTELADVGVWFWDLVSGTLSWSDRCKAQFALPAGQSPSIDYFYSMLHPEDRERVRTAIERSRSERTEFRTAYRVMLPDGSQRELAAIGRCTFDALGKPLSLGGVTLDVTRIARLESDLRKVRAVSAVQATELELARRFQVVAETASDVVMETDTSGLIRWVTPSVMQQIGRRPEEMVGAPYASSVHPDDRTIVHTIEQQVQQGAAATAEVRLRRADGTYRWFFLSLRPRFDDGHTVVGNVGGWRDIHDAVLAREAVNTERHRLRAQMTSMINPLVLGEPVRDEEGRVVDFVYADVNPAACTFFGVDREHILGRRLLALFPQLEATGLLARFAETADTGRRIEIDDFPLPMAGGDVHWMDIRAVRADGWVSFVWRDNTERRRAMERISASEEQFRLLAENSLDVVARIDANDTVTWVSPSVTNVLGWKVADCIGHSALDFLATEEGRQQYRRDKARAFSGAGSISRSQIRSASGEVHWLETHSSPYRTADGRIDSLIAAMRVIDAEVLAEQALERRARTDDLTQLLNRSELMERLGRLVERGKFDFAVLWCDIDRFKGTNDTHGHAAGDAVLVALGERIRGCLPTPDDLGARIGGDELMVVLRGTHDLDAAAQVAERLRDAAACPIPFADGTISVTLSIGVTRAVPGESVDAILARADDAMYQAKEHGRNRVVAIPESTAAMRTAS